MSAQPSAAPDGTALSDADLVSLARRISQFRRKRDAMLGPLIFADPEWDILLDLFVQDGLGRKVGMSSLCIAAAVPVTTAFRCVNAMVQSGALVKSRDEKDARRVLIALTDETHSKMRALLEHFAQFTPLG